jgi:alpha-N-arabinofuranosidase
VTGIHNEEDGTLTFFAVNRNGDEAIDLDIALEGFGNATVVDHQVMTHVNLEAVNTAKNPDEVTPAKGTGAVIKDGRLSVKLPAYSYQMIRAKL